MKKTYILEIEHEEQSIVVNVLMEFLDEWLGHSNYKLTKYEGLEWDDEE